jgi:hypothetical protein
MSMFGDERILNSKKVTIKQHKLNRRKKTYHGFCIWNSVGKIDQEPIGLEISTNPN